MENRAERLFDPKYFFIQIFLNSIELVSSFSSFQYCVPLQCIGPHSLSEDLNQIVCCLYVTCWVSMHFRFLDLKSMTTVKSPWLFKSFWSLRHIAVTAEHCRCMSPQLIRARLHCSPAALPLPQAGPAESSNLWRTRRITIERWQRHSCKSFPY